MPRRRTSANRLESREGRGERGGERAVRESRGEGEKKICQEHVIYYYFSISGRKQIRVMTMKRRSLQKSSRMKTKVRTLYFIILSSSIRISFKTRLYIMHCLTL